MPNGTYGGVRGRETKVGRKLSFPSYSIEHEAVIARKGRAGIQAEIAFS